MTWTDTAAALVAISGGLIAAVGAVSSFGINRRAQYDRVRTETATLTTGDIAASRHRVGQAIESSGEDQESAITPDLYGDFYAVLWTFERIYGLFISLKPVFPRFGRVTRPERLLLVSVRGAASTWVKFANLHPTVVGDTSVSSVGVRNLHRLAQALTEPRTLWQFLARSKVEGKKVESRRAVMREIERSSGPEGRADRHLVTIKVDGLPATFATAREKSWKEAVRAAVAGAGIRPQDARFSVRIEFRVATPHNGNEVWDLDNLIKPTLDAMEGVFGARSWEGRTHAADDRIDRLEAVKRSPHKGEPTGATIGVWIIPPG
jgi:hypothetical protein